MRWTMSVLLGLGACAGVSPRPNDATAESLPTRTFSADELSRLAALDEVLVDQIDRRRYEAAEQSVAAALELDPRSARAHAVRAILRLERAKEQEPPDLFWLNSGEADTVLAEQLAPKDPFVARMRAQFLAGSGHVSAAAAAAEAGLERAEGAPPDKLAALYGLAGTYRYELGEERAALPLLESFVELRPDDATARFRIGSCLLRKSMLPVGPADTRLSVAQAEAERAARSFEKCVEIAPGDEDAALAVGAAWLRASELAGDRARAAEDQAAAGELVAQQAALFERAANQFTAVAARFERSAEAQFRIGVIAEMRSDPAAAAAAYEGALVRDANHLGSVLNLAAMRVDSDAAASAELLRRALTIDRERGGLSKSERERIEKHLAPAGSEGVGGASGPGGSGGRRP
ncbi:MAG: tetratricopeptide repeat protein [bacterium]|nr:tetratricopeptide repeat protein [bacterium]